MRLGQISRKLNVKPNDIRDFIESEFKVRIELDLNFKLDDNQIAALNENFKQPEPVVAPQEKSLVKKVVDEVEVSSLEEAEIVNEIEPIQIEKEQEVIEIIALEISSPIEKSTTVIDPFEPLAVNPDAELIKAPKIKLEGLKVVGKIDLPEKVINTPIEEPVVATEASEETPTELADIAETEKQTMQKSESATVEIEEEYSIYKDKKGIYHFSQQQRESRKNSLERKVFKKLENQKKKNKAKHYQKNVTLAKKESTDKKKAKKESAKQIKSASIKPERKGVWGKFLNWLND